ncbi:MAG: uracil-DNA glycosylase [Alphaproteobacteria bacterium]|nr:uracil-DNA glycosylase [Alphaproteobacteria bacterium]
MSTPAVPARDCALCPRLAAFRAANQAAFASWHNAPVPSFGALDARLLVVGLGPGLRGANRTGRPFTGDYAGDLLYATLLKFGFARGAYRAPRDDEAWTGDGLSLVGTRVTNAVRCVPPENKPLPAEIRSCRGFLAAEIAAMARLHTIVALGRVAHDAVLAALALRGRDFAFGHGAVHRLDAHRRLADSFHCSRYNTNTGRLTPAMFEAVFAAVQADLDATPVSPGRA